jgi:hypothetical protein
VGDRRSLQLLVASPLLTWLIPPPLEDALASTGVFREAKVHMRLALVTADNDPEVYMLSKAYGSYYPSNFALSGKDLESLPAEETFRSI